MSARPTHRARRCSVQLQVRSPWPGPTDASAFVVLTEQHCLTEASELIGHLRPGSRVQVFFTDGTLLVKPEGNWTFTSPPEA